MFYVEQMARFYKCVVCYFNFTFVNIYILENMETLEKIKEIANKKRLTQEDKEFVVAQCEALGIVFEQKKGCTNCYQDAAIQCYVALKEQDETPTEGMRLRNDVDVLVNGRRMNPTTITDEWMEELRATMPQWWIDTYFEGGNAD